MKHGIASSGAYGARCLCGHIERSTLGRMVALTQLMDHMEFAENEATGDPLPDGIVVTPSGKLVVEW